MTGLFPDMGMLSVISVVLLLKPEKNLGRYTSQWTAPYSKLLLSSLSRKKKKRKIKREKASFQASYYSPCCENQTDWLLWGICLMHCCFLWMFLWLPAVGCSSSYNFPKQDVLSSQAPFSVSWLTFSKSASDRFLLACATHFSASVCKERKWE